MLKLTKTAFHFKTKKRELTLNRQTLSEMKKGGIFKLSLMGIAQGIQKIFLFFKEIVF